MAIYIKGNSVPNAQRYILLGRLNGQGDGTYTEYAEQVVSQSGQEINFNLSNLRDSGKLSALKYDFVVQARATDYEDSNYSNVITCNLGTGEITNPNVYTFQISPSPSSATVTMNGENRSSIQVAPGTSVNWSVSASGYVTQSGTETINGDVVKNVTLVEESGGDVPDAPEEPEEPGFVDPRLSHPQVKTGASVPSNGIITEDMTIVLEDCWMNGTYAYLSWNPEGSGGESNTTYTDDYFYCYLPVDISQYTKIDVTANDNNAAYYQFFTGDLKFTTTGGRIKVDKGTSVAAQTIPSGAKYLLLAHHRIKEGAYSDYYPTVVKLYK